MNAVRTVDPIELVAEFIRTFRASLDFRLWVKLCEEERKELIEAMEGEPDADVLKEMADLAYVYAGAALTMPDGGSHILPVDEMESFLDLAEDIEDLLHEAMAICRFTDEVTLEALRRVHASNMSKLGDDGKPIKREDGKVLKGPNYTPPDLSDLVAA